MKMRSIVAGVIARVLRLWYALRDERTPGWARGVVWGLLAYLVWPLDALPDYVPVVGWSDDLLALIAAAVTLQWYSRGEIAARARRRARALVGLEPEGGGAEAS